MNKKLKLVDEISEKLCNEFQLVLPLHVDKLKRGKKSSEQELKENLNIGLKKFYQTVHDERLRHKLGLISRARVAFGLQQRLLQAGYAAPLVQKVLLAMLTSAFVGPQT